MQRKITGIETYAIVFHMFAICNILPIALPTSIEKKNNYRKNDQKIYTINVKKSKHYDK